MTTNNIDIQYPLGGLNRSVGYTNQPPMTSRDMQNMRGVDKYTQRLRGNQREGISNYITGGTATPAGSGKIRRIEPLVRDERRLTYSSKGTASLEWERQPPIAKTEASLVRVSQFGNVFALSYVSSRLTGAASWTKYNSYGAVLWTQRVEVPTPDSSIPNPVSYVTGFWVDEDESVYVSTGVFATGNGTTDTQHLISTNTLCSATNAANSQITAGSPTPWTATPSAGDKVRIVSGTNVTPGQYTVLSATPTTITVSANVCSGGAGSNISLQVYKDYFRLWDGGSPGRIWKWIPNANGDGYDLAWTMTVSPGYTCTDLVVYRGALYTLEVSQGTVPGLRTSRLSKYEDIYSDGVPPDPALADVIDISASVLVLPSGTDVIARRIAIRESAGYEFVICGGSDMLGTALLSALEKPFIFKMSPVGSVRWIIQSDLTQPSGFPQVASKVRGYGHGLAVDGDGNILTTGYPGSSSGNYAMKFSDKQSDTAGSVSADISYDWGVSASSTDAYNNYWGYIATDKYESVAFPKAQQPGTARAVVYTKYGALASSINAGGSAVPATIFSCAFAPFDSLIDIDFKDNDYQSSEYVYAGGSNATPLTLLSATYTASTSTLTTTNFLSSWVPTEGEYVFIEQGAATIGWFKVESYTSTTIKLSSNPFASNQTGLTITVAARPLFKHRILTVAQEAGSPRSHICAVIAPPHIQTFTQSGGYVTPALGPNLRLLDPSKTDTSVIDSGSRYISSASLIGNLFISDGLNYFYLDPKSNSPTYTNGKVELWQPKTSGYMPQRAKLVFSWRDRIGLSRCPDDPQNFYLSATNDPFDWDLNPPTPTITQAFVGNLTPAGLLPDLPNAFIPYTDDVLIVLCDHSIWQVSGNPLRGGEIDRISGVVGGSFGKPYCVDPEGAIYFHGSRGGIFVMAPKSTPIRLSTESIDADLAEIDLNSYFVELAWDDRAQGVHVFQLPYGAGGTPVQHWFFERRTKAWIPQKYGRSGSTGNQPTAVAVYDGDSPNDRRILLAGEDRRIGYFDTSAKGDRSGATNGSGAIYSYALIGPIVTREQNDRRSRLCHLEVTLASDRGGCNCEVYMSDVPDVIGGAAWSGELQPGYNRVNVRARGRYIFLRLYNSESGRDWAFESASASIADAGRVRS